MTNAARFRHIAETASDVIVCCTLDGVWTYLSPSALTVLGYKPAELIGKPITLHIHPDDRASVADAFRRGLAGESVADVLEHRMLHKNGSTVWVESRPSLRRDPKTGEVIEIQDALRDISERKLAERIQADKEEHFRLLAESVHDLVTRFDMEGSLSYVSPSARQVLGYRPEEMVWRSTWEFIHPDDHARLRAAYRALIAAPPGEMMRIEYRAFHRDGGIRHLEASPTPVRDPATGKIVEFFDVTRDVSERRSSEAALEAALAASETARKEAAESEARYRLLAESARDITIQLNPNGELIYASPAISVLGYAEEDVVGRPITDFIHLDDVERAIASTQRLFTGEVRPAGERDEFRIRSKSGEYLWYEGNPSLIRDADGEILHVTSSLRDTGERHALEESLIAARTQAEAAGDAKAEFLANMSHELRTPLTSVIGFSQLIQAESGLSDSVRKAVDRIAAGGKALLAIINDVLDFSKIEAGDIQVDPAPTPIDPLLRETVELLRLRAQEKELSLEVTGLSTLPPFVRVDANRVRQVLLNLVGNAVKFCSEGGVEVAAYFDSERETLDVRVIDTGPGIPEDAIGELFQRFRQVDSSISRKFGGTGLGLAISKGLVEAMGGQIGVESKVGEGSTFWFNIPAPFCAQVEMTRGGEDQVQVLAGRNVLVVDDNAESREVIGVILKACGLVVETAGDGASALEAVEQQRYDVIILDWRMPGMDGVETAKAIREGKSRNRFAPILLCSTDRPDLRSDEAALFDGTITKPVSPANLLGGLAAVIDDDPVGALVGAERSA